MVYMKHSISCVKCDILYHTYSTSTFKHNLFLPNQPLHLGCCFEKHSPFFRTGRFSLFSAESLHQNVRIDRGVIFTSLVNNLDWIWRRAIQDSPGDCYRGEVRTPQVRALSGEYGDYLYIYIYTYIHI